MRALKGVWRARQDQWVLEASVYYFPSASVVFRDTHRGGIRYYSIFFDQRAVDR